QNRAVGKSPFTPQLFSLFSHSCCFPSASKNNSVMIHQPHFLQVIIFPRLTWDDCLRITEAKGLERSLL
ncbi:hypothetical protein LEMLEM_LOCUS19765, partial [Lemmus lemmus]